MNTIENNKLLAEFLGWEIYSKYFYRIPSNLCEHNGERKDIPLEGMVFDTNWNWLMQVVKEINVIDDYRFTVKILSMDVEIYDNVNNKNVIDYFSPYSCDELERGVYEACVQFVKWYNQQK